jgi:hypothetical protein
MDATGPRDFGPRDDLLFSDMARYLAALAAGVFVGSTASLLWAESSYQETFGVGFLALFVGGIAFGIAYRSALTLVGELASVWCWSALQGSLAPHVPSETFGGFELAMAFIGGLALAMAAYVVSLLFRLRPRPKVGRRPGLVLGLISVIVFGSSVVVVAATPYGSSFTIETPAGWAPHSVSVDWNVGPEYGTTFRASVSGIETPLDSTGPLVPMLGVSVLRREFGDYATSDCLMILDTWGGPSSWLYSGINQREDTSLSPAISGAHEVLVKTPAGDRIYALDISRNRMVGFVPENLCYLVVISLPADSMMTEAQVNDIFATFRFR